MDSKDFTSGSGDGNGRQPTAESPVMVVTTELKAGTLSLPEVLMQNVAVIAPAIASLFYTPVVVGLAGLTSPLAYPIAFVITLMLGMVLVQFTKKMPTAGGYYTYISRSLHPRLGWLVAWLFILYAPTVGGMVSLYMGNILQQELQSNLDPDMFWRVHRSYLVNIHRIKEVIPWFKSSFQLRMDDKKQTEIPVSRVQTKRLRALLKL